MVTIGFLQPNSHDGIIATSPMRIGHADVVDCVEHGAGFTRLIAVASGSHVQVRDTDGNVLRQGEQVQIGGNETYVSLCRKHWRAAMEAAKD